MKKVFLYIFLLLTPIASAQIVTDTLADAVDSTARLGRSTEVLEGEILMLDDLIEPMEEEETSTVTINYQLTDLDCRLMDWAMEWLDTTACESAPSTITLTEEEMRKKLAALPCVIEMPYNTVVKRYIEMYLGRPKQLAALKRLSEYYFPYFEDQLTTRGLPQELKYLAVIESALNANIYSRVGAAGLWQFMPSTGKHYGLEVNSLIDERLDPYKSTVAACRMLRSLYRVYGDWNLAIASYNCGPGNVNRAIHRSNGKKDFWEIYPWLPAETRGYLPCFIAATFVLSYADEFGICPEDLVEENKLTHKQQLMSLLVDTVMTDKRQHLKQTADVVGIPLEELRKLNPQYMKDIIPGGKAYPLVLPVELVGAYIDLQDTIVKYMADSLINSRREEIQQARVTPNARTHKVKKGDTLGGIAKRYHCTVKQLQTWNGLKGTNIRIGQVLKIKK